MKSKDIRNSFLEFFKSKGMTAVPSSSLIPTADPTLLFTSAGMVQFKANFLGIDKSLKNAVSVQKCVRTTDIDNVGFTNRHLTFFEMLGNFSFGDYFKEEAIAYAWEYLTTVLKLDPAKLYVSIYKGGIAQRDDDAYNAWLKYVPAEKISELSEKDNFWTMGPTGPCGPCSEIYYDFGKKGEEHDCKGIECECGRYVEIWNLVFTQFDRAEDGTLTPLPQKNIDTGMGLERLTMAVQKTASLYETDLFTPITEAAKKILNITDKDAAETATLRIVADHVRSSSFLIAEGILPSNEGRGYILRRLVRRALRYGKIAGATEPFLHKLVPVVKEEFGGFYPEIKEHYKLIINTLTTEENAFFKTLETGECKLDEMLKECAGNFEGEKAFYLHETFGFPVELTQEIVTSKGKKFDMPGYEKAKKEAQEKSRSYADEFSKEKMKTFQQLEATLDNKFVGYEKLETKAKVLVIVNEDIEFVDSLSNAHGYVVLDTTPFYATSGGQVGDTGTLEGEGFTAKVSIAERPIEKLILHRIHVAGTLKKGQEVLAKVDSVNRRKTAANHTAIHMVNTALRRVLGESVHQAGSFVSPQMFRFDYTTPKAPTHEELEQVLEIANDEIMKEHPVYCELRPLSETKKLGAITLPGEKYADPARYVMVGGGFDMPQDKYSLELCGGTHVRNTNEIIMIIPLKESAVSSGVRRIEGVAGMAAIEYLKNIRTIFNKIAKIYMTSPNELENRVTATIEEMKNAKKEINDLRQKLLTGGAAAQEQVEELKDGLKLVSFHAKGAHPKELRIVADTIAQKNKGALILVGVDTDGKRSFVVKAAEGCTADAANLAKNLGAAFNGKAGGRADFAQGGCDPVDWGQFLKKAKEILS
ncbi:alanyl-tRNA synthetase [Elusimicrobium posterum]|uniref:alanine--tRNA ligase n=1 Tax=Elusimicrobium posterum TaxID=3116653 RepID=UPI003C7917B1